MSVPVSDDLVAGRYRLEDRLGAGGAGEVFRARDVLLDRDVAVKLVPLGPDAPARRRFDNEVRTLAGLSHPALVAVHDAGTSGDVAFVVLQLIEGTTLRGRLAHGPLPVAEVRRLGTRLAEALAHVHARGVVHRDVKPSNILLDADGDAHLADFGLAHLTGATRLTRSDQIVGTAAYLAPEQVRGAAVDHPADVYALGLVLLECLTGRPEYQGSEVEAAVARLHRPPVVPDDLPDDLVRLLTAMTASAPEHRPTAVTCARVLDGVEPVVESTFPLVLTDVGEAPPKAPVAMSKRALVASAAVLVGAVGATWAATSGSAPVTSVPPVSAPSVVVSSTAPAQSQVTSPAPVAPQGAQPVTAGTGVPVDAPRVDQPAPRHPAGPPAGGHAPQPGGDKAKPAGKAKKN